MLFSQKLKELRTAKGVSQVELAENIYVSRSAVAKWESGLGFPSAESLNLLAEYFLVGVEELCADKSSESVIVKKNVTISKSRKIIIAVTAVSLTVIIALVVCVAVYVSRYKANAHKEEMVGNSLAEVVGIYACVYNNDQEAIDYRGNNRNYICESLVVGEQYTFRVSPILTGGSRPAVFPTQAIKLNYDEEIFDISLADDKPINPSYALTIKKPCTFVGVEIKADGHDFSAYLILSAVENNSADVDN